ncbi:60S ribosomal protein L18a-like [Teleopsis dalmanni]|uniref:60S ribosomal protein L18a-like n=1 Tax=Teleopsis dalmanni TaxID=139649 RepID=UPI0018CCBF5B|nr:60S ribosomal protein L18a-like [Teleopsis dalmanni]
MDMSKELKEYKVTGRKWLTRHRREAFLFYIHVFAANKREAKTAFWFYVEKMAGINRQAAHIFSCERIYVSSREKIRFAFWVTYPKRTGFRNTISIYKNKSVNNAVTKLLWHLGARRRALARIKVIFNVNTGFVSEYSP